MGAKAPLLRSSGQFFSGSREKGPARLRDMIFDDPNRLLAKPQFTRIVGYRGVLEVLERALPAGEPGLPMLPLALG